LRLQAICPDGKSEGREARGTPDDDVKIRKTMQQSLQLAEVQLRVQYLAPRLL
jgi:hypothetical protein